MAFLVMFRYEMSLNIIAALLTIIGYSVNDTIVIFDRIREDMKLYRGRNFKDIANLSVNQTLDRTILTSFTALLSVTALLVFGGEVLRGFAFTMIVGILTGTYSSVFIAAAIVTFWPHGRGGARIVAAAPAIAVAKPSATARQRKGSRSGAKAS